MSVKRDYYEVLSVTRDADGVTVKKAYRRLAVELHPDRNPDNPQAEESFKEASEAYQILSDPEKRAMYDRYGHNAPRGGGAGFSDVSDIFSAFGDIFGDMFGGGGRRRVPRGADIETEVQISLLDVVHGVAKDIEVKRHVGCEPCKGSGAKAGTRPEKCGACGGAGQVVHQQGFLMIQRACSACRGTGQLVKSPCESCGGNGLQVKSEKLAVQIPAGVDDGSTLRLVNRGESPPGGGQAGNLFVHIRVQPDARFERDGTELHTALPLSFAQAALGASRQVPTLTGEEEIQIPAGTQPGDTMVLKGLGLPRLQTNKRGAIVVHLQLQVPKKFSAEQETHLRAFAKASGDEVAAEKTGIFGRKKK